MTLNLPAMVLLHGGCAVLYITLAALILVRQRTSRTGAWLTGACLITGAWAVAVAWSWQAPFQGFPAWLELARSAAWYGFILHLYRRTVTVRRQLTQILSTMGLLALLLVGGLPLTDLLSHQPASTLWSLGAAVRLGFAVGNIPLLNIDNVLVRA